jgi:hypothetical protein
VREEEYLTEFSNMIEMPNTSSPNIGNVVWVVVPRLKKLRKLQPDISESLEIGYPLEKTRDGFARGDFDDRRGKEATRER